MILLPVMLPLLAGALLPIIKPGYRARGIYVISTVVLTSFFTLWAMSSYDMSAGVSFTLLSLADGMDISFSADGVSYIFTVIFMISWLLAAIYAPAYIKHEGADDRFFAYFLLSFGAVIGLCLAANLVTMYLCFELVTLASFPLVLHSLKKEAVNAALKYLFYSMAGGFAALFGIFIIYSHTDGGIFIPGGSLNEGGGMLLFAVMLTIIGFGTKAGMYPMHGWLPTAHPVAPAPASAILSGVIAKAGVVAVIRVVFYTVGAESIRGTWVQSLWLALAMLTVVMGSMMAYREKGLKKRLAYSTVSNVSYIMLGLACLSASGALGALFHVMAHAFAKNALFLAAGAIIYKTGYSEVEQLRGIGKRMPVTMWCFAISSLSLIGIPPMAGFTSKWYLASAGASLENGPLSVLAPAALIISALLTAAYLLSPVVSAFFPGNDHKPEPRAEAPASMTVPLAFFTALSVLCGLFGSPIAQYISAATAPLFM